jgi:hypothetical protein
MTLKIKNFYDTTDNTASLKFDSKLRAVAKDKLESVLYAGDDSNTIYYKNSQGRLGEQMLFRFDEARLELAEVGRVWKCFTIAKDDRRAKEAGQRASETDEISINDT